jgi:hypothetical protein
MEMMEKDIGHGLTPQERRALLDVFAETLWDRHIAGVAIALR